MRANRKEILSITLKILGSIILVSGIIVAPGLAILLRQFKPRNKKEFNQFRSSIYYLKKKGLINYKNLGGEIKIGLTAKGERAYKFLSIDDIKTHKSNVWDDLWRIVTFDIPEHKKTVRDALRFKLKDLGFYPYQKSLFVYPYDCKNEIDLIKEFYGAHNYIFLIVAKKLDGEDNLKKHFFK